MSWATRLPDAERTAAAAAAESVTPAEFARRQAARGAGPTSWPRVAPILESPWPELHDCRCDTDCGRTAKWVVWTDEDTGDGIRPSCAECLGGWVNAVTIRLRM